MLQELQKIYSPIQTVTDPWKIPIKNEISAYLYVDTPKESEINRFIRVGTMIWALIHLNTFFIAQLPLPITCLYKWILSAIIQRIYIVYTLSIIVIYTSLAIRCFEITRKALDVYQLCWQKAVQFNRIATHIHNRFHLTG